MSFVCVSLQIFLTCIPFPNNPPNSYPHFFNTTSSSDSDDDDISGSRRFTSFSYVSILSHSNEFIQFTCLTTVWMWSIYNIYIFQKMKKIENLSLSLSLSWISMFYVFLYVSILNSHSNELKIQFTCLPCEYELSIYIYFKNWKKNRKSLSLSLSLGELRCSQGTKKLKL